MTRGPAFAIPAQEAGMSTEDVLDEFRAFAILIEDPGGRRLRR